jgi:hypothetical protein
VSTTVRSCSPAPKIAEQGSLRYASRPSGRAFFPCIRFALREPRRLRRNCDVIIAGVDQQQPKYVCYVPRFVFLGLTIL